MSSEEKSIRSKPEEESDVECNKASVCNPSTASATALSTICPNVQTHTVETVNIKDHGDHAEKHHDSEPDCDFAVSMVDVLKEEEELEGDAAAVLGDGDVNNCTYDQGYVARQPLYACLTCTKEDSTAGICLACSYECHEGHKLVELYTKRHFKCDCGNAKFKEGTVCRLRPNKMPENVDNIYGQNFKGVYCTCSRPYPDPDDSIEDEMIQCIVCEDWFHGRHLGVDVPKDDDYEEMACMLCVAKNSFLTFYQTIKVDHAADESEPVDVVSAPVSGEAEQNDGKCLIKNKSAVSTEKKTIFWPKNWRKNLCSCETCKAMYEEKGVMYLLDCNDMISCYEARGKAKQSSGSHYEQGLEALSSLDRTQQVEVIHGFNNMKAELSDYLKKFAENGKVVREEDIKEFFSEMTKKRQRIGNSSTVQYLCK